MESTREIWAKRVERWKESGLSLGGPPLSPRSALDALPLSNQDLAIDSKQPSGGALVPTASRDRMSDDGRFGGAELGSDRVGEFGDRPGDAVQPVAQRHPC